jgi:hypothetical protein
MTASIETVYGLEFMSQVVLFWVGFRFLFGVKEKCHNHVGTQNCMHSVGFPTSKIGTPF